MEQAKGGGWDWIWRQGDRPHVGGQSGSALGWVEPRAILEDDGMARLQPPIAKQSDRRVARVARFWLLSAKWRNRPVKLQAAIMQRNEASVARKSCRQNASSPKSCLEFLDAALAAGPGVADVPNLIQRQIKTR